MKIETHRKSVLTKLIWPLKPTGMKDRPFVIMPFEETSGIFNTSLEVLFMAYSVKNPFIFGK